jgi:putative ATPase
MKELGYGKEYQYAHDLKEKVADMECLPRSLQGRRYYHPTDQGMERKVQEILESLKEKKARMRRKAEEEAKK